MSDHTHSKGERDPDGFYACADCLKASESPLWWEGYKECQADIIANGLPDHKERLEAAARALMEDHGSLNWWKDAQTAIQAYLAWQKEEL